MIVNDRGEVEGDVILCHTDLSWHFDNLDLNIDLDEVLREIDLDQTRIDGAVEAPEFGDKADVSLGDRLVRIWADNAARNCTAKPKQSAEVVYYDDEMSILSRGFRARGSEEGLLIPPYQPCISASLSSPWRVCAYDG